MQDIYLLHNQCIHKLPLSLHTGLVFSTSHFFEKHLNWTAIHIEADLFNAEQLRGNRRRSVNIQAALCDSERVLHYVNVGDWNKPNAGFKTNVRIYLFLNVLRQYEDMCICIYF